MSKFINLDYYVHKLFSVPIHYLSINDFSDKKKELIEYAYKLRDKEKTGRNASNRGGWQSQPFPIDGGDVFQDLLINIISNIPSFKKNIDVKCDAWVNINPSGSFNVKHCHPNCHVAGVFWIKIPENSGDIVFISPHDFTSFIEMHSYTDKFKEDTNYYHNYSLPATEGSLLLFPSHLQHKVEENKSDEDRISMSFNLKLENDDY